MEKSENMLHVSKGKANDDLIRIHEKLGENNKQFWKKTKTDTE